MASAVSEPLRRFVPARQRVGRVLRSAAPKALIGAHVIVAIIILVRGYGWLQPFELLIYDALRVVWAGDEPSTRILLVGAPRAMSRISTGR
jgi:CHASE2 domain-containing sensor protein